MKHKRTASKVVLTLIGLSAVALLVLLYLHIKQPPSLCTQNQRILKQSITALSEDTKAVNLNDLATFDWDYVYSFYPYLFVEQMEEIIGFQSEYIRMAESEGIQQLLFVKNDEVVCAVFGYAEYVGYHINAGPYPYPYVRFSKADELLFSVDLEGKKPYLSRIQ